MDIKRYNNKELNEEFKKLTDEFLNTKKELQDLFNEQVKIVNDKSDKFEDEKNNITNLVEEKTKEFNKIEKKINDFNEYYDELFKEDKENYNIKEEIENLKNDIDEFHKYLFQDDNKNENFKKRIQRLYEDILQKKKEIYGYKEDDGTKTEGLMDKINNSLKEINDLKIQKEKDTNELLKQMELSRDAISQDSLSKFLKNRADEKRRSSNKISWFILLNNILMVILFLIGFKYIKLSENEIINFIIKLSITFPFLYFVWNLTYKYKRDIALEDQYSYKASIMATYTSISSFLKNENIEDKDEQFNILKDTFNKILENEADKIDKKDKDFLVYVEKMLRSLSKTLSITKDDSFDILKCVSDKISLIKQEEKTTKINKVKNNNE